LAGVIHGDRKLTLTRKTYYLDEDNLILGLVTWGSQKNKNEISFNNDYFEGKIVKLKSNTPLNNFDKIKESHF
jgi:hypothetical protein